MKRRVRKDQIVPKLRGVDIPDAVVYEAMDVGVHERQGSAAFEVIAEWAYRLGMLRAAEIALSTPLTIDTLEHEDEVIAEAIRAEADTPTEQGASNE